jgi:hypothetical protein
LLRRVGFWRTLACGSSKDQETTGLSYTAARISGW